MIFLPLTLLLEKFGQALCFIDGKTETENSDETLGIISGASS